MRDLCTLSFSMPGPGSDKLLAMMIPSSSQPGCSESVDALVSMAIDVSSLGSR
jgi:hypothetical protein